MDLKTRINDFLDKRPKTICAYSSNINQEKYNEIIKTDIDLILVVDDIQKWHLENIESNPKDYSHTGRIFYTSASKEKIKGFTGISYQRGVRKEIIYMSLINKAGNDFVQEFNYHFLNFNYGVIEYRDLERQLCSWNHISLANQFQSNIMSITQTDKVEELVEYNRKNLIATALLLLGETSTLTELYEMILRLSKIQISKEQKIILKEDFVKTYGKTNEFYEVLYDEDIIINRKVIETYFLPAYLEDALKGISKKDLEKRKKAIISFFDQKYKEEKYYQTLHDIKTNGVTRSTEYAFQKLKKRCTKNN